MRQLFTAEFSRLKIRAKVGSYLAVLTESNVRGMLRRKERLAANRDAVAAAPAGGRGAGQRAALRRWEDDGG